MTDAEAIVEDRPNRIQAIWLLPIAVLVIGALAVGEAYLDQGPVITVTFETAAGLQAGKTQVKALSVEVGMVEEVKLADDLGHVVVTAQLDPGTARLLRDDTQVWVVRPRFGTGGISGLGTLLSGAYIELSPGQGSMGQRKFVGLENIPATAPGVPGVRVELSTERASSVGVGDPVLYRGFQVGRVETTELDLETSQIRIGVFVDAPHDQLVTEGSRFWNASGLTIHADASGVRLSADALSSLVAGGIAFDVPSMAEPGGPVADGAKFRLYPDKPSSELDPYAFGKEYVVLFEQSLRGLEPGAPVEYLGIRVGTVIRILHDEFVGRADGNQAVAIVMRAEPGRFGLGDTAEGVRLLEQRLGQSVASGLRATLETGNLITGKLYIAFDQYPEAEAAEIGQFDGYPTLPSLRTGLQRIERQVTALLSKLNALPLDRTVSELNVTLARAKRLLASLDDIAQGEDLRALPARLHDSLRGLESTMASYGEGSEFHEQANGALAELEQTLQSLRALAQTLEERPNSLIFSQSHASDPEPRAAQ
jgi:paraquat-inducible protein B